MATRRFNEETLATAVCHQLFRAGWTVYPELGGFADIVARNPDTGDVIAIEAKSVVNLKVVAQADQNKVWTRVDGVYVAVPARASYARYLRLLCRELGIGVIEMYLGYNARPNRMSVVTARRRGHKAVTTTRRQDFEDLMIPEAEIYTTPGRPSPTSFTPFRRRELNLLRILEKTPGLTYKELALAEAEADGKKKHASRAPTYIKELLERRAFTTFEADENGVVWPRHSWGAEEAGHRRVDYSKQVRGALRDVFTPLPQDALEADPICFEAEALIDPRFEPNPGG